MKLVFNTTSSTITPYSVGEQGSVIHDGVKYKKIGESYEGSTLNGRNKFVRVLGIIGMVAAGILGIFIPFTFRAFREQIITWSKEIKTGKEKLVHCAPTPLLGDERSLFLNGPDQQAKALPIPSPNDSTKRGGADDAICDEDTAVAIPKEQSAPASSSQPKPLFDEVMSKTQVKSLIKKEGLRQNLLKSNLRKCVVMKEGPPVEIEYDQNDTPKRDHYDETRAADLIRAGIANTNIGVNPKTKEASHHAKIKFDPAKPEVKIFKRTSEEFQAMFRNKPPRRKSIAAPSSIVKPDNVFTLKGRVKKSSEWNEEARQKIKNSYKNKFANAVPDNSILNKKKIINYDVNQLSSQVTDQEVLSMQDRIHTVKDYKFSVVENPEISDMQFQFETLRKRSVNLIKLQQEGLLPTNKIKIDDVSIYYSPVFVNDKHHLAILLVESKGKVYPRIAYHSNSQGTWRVLPYASKTHEEGADALKWYGKGNYEAETELPIQVICALNNGLFASKTEESSKKYNPADYVSEIPRYFPLHKFNSSIKSSMSFFQDSNTGVKIAKKLEDEPQLWPNFTSTKQLYFNQKIPHYGEVSVSLVPSYDECLLYMFYETTDGRSFIAHIENVASPINKYGVRSHAFETNLDAPLLEYNTQIHIDHYPKNENAPRYESNDYINNWNGVKKNPFIQAYYAFAERNLPAEV